MTIEMTESTRHPGACDQVRRIRPSRCPDPNWDTSASAHRGSLPSTGGIPTDLLVARELRRDVYVSIERTDGGTRTEGDGARVLRDRVRL